MLVLVLACVVIAFAMLVLAVVTSTAAWAWGSVIASVLAFGLLMFDYVIRRRSGGETGSSASSAAPAAPAAATATPAASSTPSTSGSTPSTSGSTAGPAAATAAVAPAAAASAAATTQTAPPHQGTQAPPANQQQNQGQPPPPGQAQGRPGGPPPMAPPGGPADAAGPQGPARGRPGVPPAVLPWASASGKLGRDPSRVPGAPAGSRFLGMVPLPGTSAAARRAAGPAPVGPPPGRAGTGWPSHRSAPPPQVDPATTRIDPARLADAAAAGPPPGGVPAGPPPSPQEETPDAGQTAVVSGLDVEVLVIDEEPFFHLDRCSYLGGRDVIPIPASEALELGFGGCSWCTPVATLAATHGADSPR